MKIAITGTHSSGKTTLAMLCSEQLGLNFVRGDTIRSIVTKHFPDKKRDELTMEEVWELEQLGLMSRISAEKEHDSFISDGCTLNSIVYTEVEIGEVAKELEGFKEFCNLARQNAKTYDLLIYLPPEIPLVADGFRPTSNAFRLAIDAALRELLVGYKFYSVTGSPMERLKQVEKIMNECRV